MKTLFRFLLLAMIAFSANAADVTYKGVKPAAIIDVRTPEEFASGHIDGAINIPHEQIGEGIKSVKGLNKDSPILLYCRSGRRSAIARATLEQQGFKQVLDGGSLESTAQVLKR